MNHDIWFGVQRSWFMIHGSWFMVHSLEFKVDVRGLRVLILGVRASGLSFRAQYSNKRTYGVGLERKADPITSCSIAITSSRASPYPIQEQLLRNNEKRFRGGRVFKARRLLYHSTLGRE